MICFSYRLAAADIFPLNPYQQQEYRRPPAETHGCHCRAAIVHGFPIAKRKPAGKRAAGDHQAGKP
jgi:hypothetical protein